MAVSKTDPPDVDDDDPSTWPPQAVWDARDRLPEARTYEYRHDGHVTDVTIALGATWPQGMVLIAPRGSDLRIDGRFRADGRLHYLAFLADEGEVTAADLRRPAIIRALKTWEAVAREIGRQILAGVPEPETAISASGPAEALRALAHGAPRKPGTRKRGTASEKLLREVAAAYREAVTAGDPAPRHTLAARFGYSPAHIGRLLTQARRPRNGREALLGPAVRGKAGETGTEVPGHGKA